MPGLWNHTALYPKTNSSTIKGWLHGRDPLSVPQIISVWESEMDWSHDKPQSYKEFMSASESFLKGRGILRKWIRKVVRTINCSIIYWGISYCIEKAPGASAQGLKKNQNGRRNCIIKISPFSRLMSKGMEFWSSSCTYHLEFFILFLHGHPWKALLLLNSTEDASWSSSLTLPCSSSLCYKRSIEQNTSCRPTGVR